MQTPLTDIRYGGKGVYGVSLGILMLHSRFPRILGDMGNAKTWPFPVQYAIIKGATPDQIVRHDPRAFLENFIEAGRELIELGVSGLSTSCGFLALLQHELQAELSVPILTSSLMQVPMLQATLPQDQRVGILTISAATLTDAHLRAANVPLETPIVGTDPEGEFTQKILGDAPELDVMRCEAELVDAVLKLKSQYPEVGAVVLECTNMMPYASAMQKASGLPIYGMDTLLNWFHDGLKTRQYNY